MESQRNLDVKKKNLVDVAPRLPPCGPPAPVDHRRARPPRDADAAGLRALQHRVRRLRDQLLPEPEAPPDLIVVVCSFVAERMLFAAFTLVMLTVRSLSLEFSPTIMPS